MKKTTSALALAALVGSPAAAMATVEFGGDFDARYVVAQDGDRTADGDDDKRKGFQQRIRLQADFEADGGVSLHTRLNLFNDRWTGDASGNTSELDEQPFTTVARDHRNVALDYGYVTMPLAGGTLSIGRMISNWQFNLTTSDDRRDRIAYVAPLGGGHTGILQYDRRQAAPESEGSSALDGNQVNLAFLGPLAAGASYGFLVAQWDAGSSGAGAEGHALRGATLVAPYIEGEAGDFDYRVGGHYIGGSRGGAFTEDTFVAYVAGGFQMTPEFKLDGQVLHAEDGTLIAGGYDTFSSMIHNSLDHDQSGIRVDDLNLGGSGTEAQSGWSRTLVAARGTFEMMDWTFIGALGWVDYDNDDASEDIFFADAQAHYQLTPSTRVFGTAGYAEADDGEVFDRDNYWATSLNVNVLF
ncbi:porin [Aquisalimonas sp.]|uniref:porin n=1 Tax=Aquisalimonas sp. TaxID=1872621 RepID=UPI0025B84C65|nr:porin [Aquisalimonas sp.]